MIERKDIIADLHTHTVGSGHAFSTVSENLEHLKRYKIIILNMF